MNASWVVVVCVSAAHTHVPTPRCDCYILHCPSPPVFSPPQEMDRRVRADQRRALMTELEDKQLTFSPAINANSIRIVERLNAERLGGSVGPGAPDSAVAGAGGSAPSPARGPGRSDLPGHEQETFQPRINPRSHALYRPGLDDKDVFSRLYIMAGVEKRRTVSAGVAAVAAATSAKAAASVAAAAALTDEHGEPLPGHPKYFNNVPYEGGRGGGHDFLLRRLLAPGAAAAAAVAPATL